MEHRMENVEDIYPLSPLQQGMLFHSVYAPESGVYVIQYSCVLQGPLDIASFRSAWQRVVARHPMLRAAFIWEKLREPHHAVRAAVELPWREEDWSSLDPQRQQERLSTELAADRQRGFDLARAPLMRFALIRLAAERYGFTWTYHHLLLDGWSCTVLLDELFTIYTALVHGTEPDLAPARPYRAYLDWLAQGDIAEAESFWRRELAGLPGVTRVGIGQPHRAGEAHGDSELFARLPGALAEELSAMTRRHQLTPNTVAQGAWSILLSRYSGETDVTCGMVVSGRPAELPGVEVIVGPFINTLPMRVDVAAAAPVVPWLKRLQERQLTLRRYEYSPLAKIQKWSGIPPETPLFDTLFVFENYPALRRRTGEGPALRVSETQQIESTSYPLTVTAEMAETLRLRVSFDRRIFDAVEIARLLEHLHNVIAALVTVSDGPLGELPILAEAERHQLLRELNDSAAPLAHETSLCRLLEAQVERTPEQVAVLSEQSELTYRELDRHADRLARRLRELGCGRGDRVGVCMERSAELVVALVAVLKTGSAYLPLSPEDPQERLAFMIEDSGVAALLTQDSLLGDLPETSVPVLAVDLRDRGLDAPAGDGFDGGAGPDDPAYVLYTSGSTGRPKAVVVPHRGICNRLLWMQQAYGLTALDAVLQKTPFTFDVSIWEFFWPLLTGARLVVARPGGHRDPRYLADTIGRHGVTVVHFVPSMLRQFLAEPDLSACAGLRLVICSGEALTDDLRDQSLSRLSVELHNLYGPTEASVDVTAWPCVRGDERSGVPIGRPISNLQIYVLDGQLGLAPRGIPGELAIGGVGLAQGYLGRPDLTARAFVPDQHGGEPGARLYRTGDRVRLLPGGEIEYLERIDHQVKVRGFRIELGEIEAVLRQQPSVRDAAVTVEEWEEGHRRLIAYVVARSEEAPSADELKAALALRLPDHMVPALFVFLAALPFTASGKVDRRALPAPSRNRPEASFEPPEGEGERALAEIWAGVLKVGRVGRHDSFFSLGGDSILSLRVLSLARDRRLRLSLQQIYEHPVLRDLARVLSTGETTWESVPPFALIAEQERNRLPRDVEDAYPLARLQAGMLFHSERSPEAALYHDIFSYHLRAPFEAAALEAALARLVARHPVLRTSFALTGFSEPLQLVHRSVPVPLQIDDLRPLGVEERQVALRQWLESERRRPFVWARPPLFRVQIHRLTEEEIQLSLSFHHSILDGWSVAVFLTELFREYLALLGRPVWAEMEPPRLAYRDFVAAERLAISSEEEEAFWADNLARSTPTRIARWPSYPQGISWQVRLPAVLVDGETCRS
ncbi:MAG TPA: amino acid adenylation domain-containing protein, partial [Thermoanaerobaculia bacterium]|nr:amino acid adenylation domain-containing protein [Thermoanaerobaculia bacterium]